jgi:hypothetical protein
VVLIAVKLAARSRLKRRLTKIATLWGLTTIFPSKHEIESRQLVKQRLGVLQHRRVETFGEPAVDRREKITGFGALALITPEAGEASGGAQLEGLRVLKSDDSRPAADLRLST